MPALLLPKNLIAPRSALPAPPFRYNSKDGCSTLLDAVVLVSFSVSELTVSAPLTVVAPVVKPLNVPNDVIPVCAASTLKVVPAKVKPVPPV